MNHPSSKTSLGQVPRLAKWIVSKNESAKTHSCEHAEQNINNCVFDYGAGKIGKVDEFFSNNNIQHLPYDPYNRDHASNIISRRDVQKADIIICSNVLNVIEDDSLPSIVADIANLTVFTKKKICFITVYHKAKLPSNRTVGNHFQRNTPAQWYVDHLKRHFKHVCLYNKILMCYQDDYPWAVVNRL